jgi:hypothetical protein
MTGQRSSSMRSPWWPGELYLCGAKSSSGLNPSQIQRWSLPPRILSQVAALHNGQSDATEFINGQTR